MSYYIYYHQQILLRWKVGWGGEVAGAVKVGLRWKNGATAQFYVLCKVTRSFACVVHNQGKKSCAGCKPALNTSAVHRCSISLQNIAQTWQGAGGKASAEFPPHQGNSQTELLKLTEGICAWWRRVGSSQHGLEAPCLPSINIRSINTLFMFQHEIQSCKLHFRSAFKNVPTFQSYWKSL